jgi:hypothetical protein
VTCLTAGPGGRRDPRLGGALSVAFFAVWIGFIAPINRILPPGPRRACRLTGRPTATAGSCGTVILTLKLAAFAALAIGVRRA